MWESINREICESAVVGKMCEPRLKSQRMEGRDRDAGWDCSSGISKSDSVAIAPLESREMVMLAV